MSSDVISELDRCFRYGDGLFETILFVDQEPVLFDQHISRLTRGVRTLGLNYVVEPDDLLTRCRAVIHEYPQFRDAARFVVRVQLSRGEGGRGYAPPDPSPAVGEFISCHAAPQVPPVIRLRHLDTRLMISRLLCGIKHSSRIEQVLAASELQHSNGLDGDDCWEGLMHDELGYLSEGTRTNIIIESAGRLLTPLLDRSGLRSTLLDSLDPLTGLTECPASVRMRLDQTGDFQVLDAAAADRDMTTIDTAPVSAWHRRPLDGMAVCNSVIGVRRVHFLGRQALPVSPQIDSLADIVNLRLGYV